MRGGRRAAVSALLARCVRIARCASGEAITLLLALSSLGAAQQDEPPVYFDGSLGIEGPAYLPPGSVEYQIDYCPSCVDAANPSRYQGELVGTSLFHSLLRMNVPSGYAARFLVSESNVSVDHIFARITSGKETQFYGDLRSDLDADIYLLNPHGVVFGATSHVDINGTFYVSTADELRFDDGKTFEARAGGTVPLIEVGAPSSFGFLLDETPPARILFDSDGGLLSTTPGASLTAVAGRIEVDDEDGTGASARIASTGGQIKLAAVPAGTDVPVDVESLDVDSLPSDEPTVQLARGASISVSGAPPDYSGRIVIRAGRFEMAQPSVTPNAAVIRSTNTGAGTADNPAGIDIKVAGMISVDGGWIQSLSQDTQGGNIRLVGKAIELFRGAAVDSRLRVSGTSGSDIYLEASTVDVLDGSTIGSRADNGAAGKVGDIMVLADQLTISGSGRNVRSPNLESPSAIFTENRGSGDGATIRVDVTDVAVEDGARILANRLGGDAGVLDDAGRIEILAENLSVSGEAEISSLTSTGIAGASIQIGAAEDPLTTLTVVDGQIASDTTAKGRGGDVDVHAESIVLDRTLGSAFNPQIRTSTTQDGPGGNLTIHAGSVQLKNGSQFRAITEGNESALGGTLTVDVDGLLSADGTSAVNSTPSGIFANSEGTAAGHGGDLEIMAQDVVLTAGAEFSARADSVGNAGNLKLMADSVLVEGDPEANATSTISVRGTTGSAGNLSITTDRLQVHNQGIVTASTSGSGQSGNLEIIAREVDIAGQGSGVFAQSNLEFSGAGRAGAVSLAPPDGEQLTLRVRDGALLSVESKFNAAGTVEIVDAALIEVSNEGKMSASVGNVTVVGDEEPRDLASDIRTVNANTVRVSHGTMSAETTGTGVGGNIQIDAGDVFLSDGSSITTKSTAAIGGGDAGDVVIAARGTFQSENSSITTTAENAGGGRISIQAGDLVYLYESLVETTVKGENDVAGADAGDIDIPLRRDEADASLQRLAAAKAPQADGGLDPVVPEFVVINGSVIRANANATNAGNITINGANVFISSDSLIQATSEKGLSGEIQISAPDADIASQVTVLPSSFVDPSDRLLPPCVARTERTGSFMVRGRDALPRPLDAPLPSSLLDAPAVGGNPPASGTNDCSVPQERS